MTNAERRHVNALPKSLKPLSSFAYVLYTVLFALGPIGLIAAIVYAFTAKNLNLRKFARAALVIWIILIAAVAALFVMKVITLDSLKAAVEALVAAE